MKEFTIEQKAKRYDEAIERAEKWRNAPNVDKIPTFADRIIDDIFPEFKESEDDRIRKAIYSALKYLETELSWDFLGDVDILDAYAWLEKQGEKDKFIKELGEYKVKYTQEALKKHINSMSNKDDERLRKTTIAFLKDFAKQGYENAVECIDWLEKQGKQTSDPRYIILDKLIEADNIYQMSVNDAMVQEAKTKAIDALSKLEIGNLLELEKQGEKEPIKKSEYVQHRHWYMCIKDWLTDNKSVLFRKGRVYIAVYEGIVSELNYGKYVCPLNKYSYEAHFRPATDEEILQHFEQKPVNGNIVKTIKERIIDYFDNHLMLDSCFSIGGLKNDILRIVNEIKQDEQKPTNKVEPKFHEGDWVTIKE